MPADGPGPAGGRLIVVCGMTGAGKTTLAEEICRRIPALRVSADVWMARLGVDLWDEDFRHRVESLQRDLTAELLSHGLTVVVEWGTWRRSERDDLAVLARAAGATVEVRYLPVDPDTAWARLQRRGGVPVEGSRRLTRGELAGWFALFEAPTYEEMRNYDEPLRLGLAGEGGP